ncbi:MAG: type II toxin-antitoxin system VapC family toxin [Calditrichaceae bacterium]|nr:type II toxin-antitoxin system VapC family toxin [Calditrichaceae bacterium]MBN2707968.1 type II toxin-antitoxin system VapC family toxin [Calditrichaceae bacterium]RQV95931.1 MAG: PIN domain-containing protein [Calditrichota bacterium]
MKIVVDTSIIIAVITNERNKKKLIKLTEGADLIAPSSLHWEIANAFSAMFKRNRIDLEKAKIAIKEYKKIPVQFYDIQLEAALEYSYEYDLYAYDAYFLVCAKNLNVPLLSIDNTLIKKAEKIGIKLLEVEK